jgi:HupE / UreJ protein
MRRALCLLLAAWPAAAHVMSMSSGDLTIEGARAHYELRMPLYEITHVANPERLLLDHVRFTGARMTRSECRADSARDAYLCSADYEFSAPVDRVEVECTLAAVTVPNHVHLLRAEMGGKRDEGIFDLGFTRATLRFRPPTAMETAVTQAGAGAVRALGGAVQLLFLVALAIAARSWREMLAITAAFLLGQCASALAMPLVAWQPAPRFVEAAMALAVAYLAVEVLLLPEAGVRWLVTFVLGLFHGMYFHLFLQTTGYSPVRVLAGAALAEVVLLSLMALAALRAGGTVRRVAAGVLLLFGTAWFVVRLRG